MLVLIALHRVRVNTSVEIKDYRFTLVDLIPKLVSIDGVAADVGVSGKEVDILVDSLVFASVEKP